MSSKHLATYATFGGSSENRRRVGTVYVTSYMEAYNHTHLPYFRWRNLDVYRDFCYWKKENNL